MTQYRPGQTLTLPDGRHVVVWSLAPDPGHYWCHLDTQVVLVKVRQVKSSALPLISLVEET